MARGGIGLALKEKLLDKVVAPIPKGATTQVYLATGADAGGKLAAKPPSLFWDQGKPGEAAASSTDPATAKRLWEVSEKLTGAKWGF